MTNPPTVAYDDSNLADVHHLMQGSGHSRIPVGGTTLNHIKPTGLTDYRDSLSTVMMNDAPFGGRLGLRHGYDRRIPTPQMTYYRWLYRRQAETAWHEFTETVAVHYVKERGTVRTFPVYVLGPKGVNGRNLYEFRPDDPPAEAGATTYWPTTDWFADIYSGFLNSAALADGEYLIKLEVFDADGNQARPEDVPFSFIVPTGTTADGTVTTRTPTALDDGGFAFALHIDNRPCRAVIDPPMIGTSIVTGPCGFLLYGAKSQRVKTAFHATHPANFATFLFHIVRGTTPVTRVAADVTAPSPDGYTGDRNGNFRREFTVAALLGPCPEKAAFAENLHVRAKATNGWRHRLNGLDAHHVRAFALAPELLE